jgi:putative transposase
VGFIAVPPTRDALTSGTNPTGTGRTRWAMRWKPVIDAFAITFSDRWPAAETY